MLMCGNPVAAEYIKKGAPRITNKNNNMGFTDIRLAYTDFM